MNLREFISESASCLYNDKSALWVGLADAMKVHLRDSSVVDPVSLLQTMDKFGKELHYGYYIAESKQSLNDYIWRAKDIKKKVSRRLKEVHAQCEGNIEDVAAYIFLDSVGLFEQFLDLSQALSFQPDMSSARHFYYVCRLREILSEQGLTSARVLEIGAGAANLAVLLRHYGLVRDYTIIDLPEMLLVSGANLEYRFGHPCRLLEMPTSTDVEGANYLVAANQEMSGLPQDSFDLILNFNSFSEMMPSVVAAYFDSIYRAARDGAVFMNVNRIQEHKQPDGTVFNMNPLLFPYRTSDQIIVLDADPFQQYVRQFCRSRHVKSTAIMRASVIRKPSCI